MALYAPTTNPEALLTALKAKIDNQLTQGSIRSWSYEPHPDGHDRFTIINPREKMDRAASFLPLIEPDRVIFILQPPPRSVAVPRIVFTTYHRLLLQTLLHHCYHLVTNPTVTPEPIPGESPITHQPAHLAFR